jgi:hypothetical protein
MANVKARIDLKCMVCIINDKSDPDTRPPREGKQNFDMHKCETDVISEAEWTWRFATAKAVLCNGVGYPGDEEGESYYGGEGIGEEFM